MSKKGNPYQHIRNAKGQFERVPYSLTLKQRYSRKRTKRLSAQFAPKDAYHIQQVAANIGVSSSDLIATVIMEYCRNSPDFPEIQHKP